MAKKRRIAPQRGLPDGLEDRVKASLDAINAYRQELRRKDAAQKLALELEAREGPMLLDTSGSRHDRQHIKAVLDNISEQIAHRKNNERAALAWSDDQADAEPRPSQCRPASWSALKTAKWTAIPTRTKPLTKQQRNTRKARIADNIERAAIEAQQAKPLHNAQWHINNALASVQAAIQASIEADYGDHIITELATAMDHIETALRPATNERTAEAQRLMLNPSDAT